MSITGATLQLSIRISACFVLVTAAAPTLVAADGFHAGAAKVDITPPVGCPLWGYASRKDKPCTGIRDRLYARALTISVGKRTMALVSLDLGRAPTRTSYQRIQKQLRPGIERLFLVASHTHHGPVIELDDWPSREKSYVRFLETRIIDVVRRAHKNEKPARLHVLGLEVDFNRNRHSRLEHKIVDRTLTLLHVTDRQGKSLALAANFAAHPTMLERTVMEISADWPGAFSRMVEQKLDVPCLFLQGACGDLSVRANDSDPDVFGKNFAQAVLAAVAERKFSELQPGLATHEEWLTFKPRMKFDNIVVRLSLGMVFYPKLVNHYERAYREGVQTNLSVALLDEKLGIVGASGEFFCGHALSLRRRARLPFVMFLGYCNGYQQYFPTIEAAAEGGYGTEPYLAPADLGSGERLTDRALIRLYQLRRMLPADPK
ncbi:MAG: alkaline ceramidase [Gemmatales bacterium]|nr:MAG: alkaline ceramidase [Gemmatales bacterium]